MQDNIAAGWLKGATDLLLIAWSDDSDSHGTGHYVARHYLIARVATRSVTKLLQRQCNYTATRQHASYGYGTGSHFFSMEDGMLVDTFHCSRELRVESPHPLLPLYHPERGDGSAHDEWIAVISETVIQRHHYRRSSLTSAGVELWFTTTQPQDTLDGITQFYFGPLAPHSVLLGANPLLVKQLTSGKKEITGWGWLAEGTRLKIPLPQDWITKHYEH
jgi:hypothetical protein